MSAEIGPISPARLIQILNALGIPINANLATILAQLDVALSTRASEATVAAILAKMDNPANPITNDVLDRAARLLGIVYGNQAQLQQVPGTLELITEDTGANTNPERWLHENHWDCDEVTIIAAGVGGQQNLGAVVGAGVERRIREITIRHAGSNNTVVTLLIAGGATRLTIDVPAQSTRTWSSQDGRVFVAAQQPAVQSSDVTGGSTFVSCSGVEAAP